MSLWRLVIAEIRFRKLNFLIGVLAVTVAVACLVCAVHVLDSHDRRTEEILAEKERESAREMAALEDSMRKITRDLGFNVRILPQGVNLDFGDRNYADKFLPEDYVERLAGAGVVSINHLLPLLQQKFFWPELETTILLSGTRGEVPILNASKKKPIQDAVLEGAIVLGYDLHRRLARERGQNIRAGDSIALGGRTFKIQALHGRRGDFDDITAWISLKEAQEILGKKGLISGMLALECNCAKERLGAIRGEIAAVLPDTQVEEYEAKADVRARSRLAVAEQARAALERERRGRETLRAETESFAAILVPIVAVACVVWLAVMALVNVRERRGEVGLLRALGLGTRQLLTLFLSRAALVGVLGGAAGYLAGASAGMMIGETPGWIWQGLWGDPALLGFVLIGGPVISALACWLPALIALRQDPAVVLQQESA